MNLLSGEARAILAALERGEIRCVELVQSYLDRIEIEDTRWHAYVDVYRESALAQAQAADAWRDSGLPRPALLGLPISIKDMFEIEGRVTTCGSAAWRDRVSSKTSAVLLRLMSAGAIILGKTHMGEFAYGGWGINPQMGTPVNPWGGARAHHAPGGPSSGAAVAVAASLASAAIGSDTGGSVRVPAAFNGLTGFKPTRTHIDTSASLPMCRSMDSIGVLTHSVADARLLFSVMQSGATVESLYAQERAPKYLQKGLEGKRIAYLPSENLPCEVHGAVHQALVDTKNVLKSLGAELIPVALPFDLAEMMRVSDQLILSEAYAFHAEHIDDTSLAFGAWVAGRIRRGKHIRAEEYLAAVEHRRRLTSLYNETLKGFDVFLLPVTPGPAPVLDKIDEDRTNIGLFTRFVNYVDTCALSIQAGVDSMGMPVGVQLVGQAGKDWALLDVGEQIQANTDWHLQRAPIEVDQRHKPRTAGTGAKVRLGDGACLY